MKSGITMFSSQNRSSLASFISFLSMAASTKNDQYLWNFNDELHQIEIGQYDLY